MIKTVEWTNEGVRMLDQRLLPTEEKYLTLRSYEEVADAIKKMVVRGALAIGVSAAMGLALGASQSVGTSVADLDRIQNVARAFATLLPNPYVHRRQRKRGGLHNAAARIAEQDRGMPKQAPIGHCAEIDEHLSILPGCDKGARALDQCAASRVRIGINEEDLLPEIAQGRKNFRRFLNSVVQQCDRMINAEHRAFAQSHADFVLYLRAA